MKRENLREILNLGGEILREKADDLMAAEVNPNFAAAMGEMETSKGPASITISIYRGEWVGKLYLNGEVYICEKTDTPESSPKWGHRTLITSGDPGPFTNPDDIEVVMPLTGGTFYVEDNFCETTISSEEALFLIRQVLQGQIYSPSNLSGNWKPYSKVCDEAEKKGGVLGDLGIYF